MADVTIGGLTDATLPVLGTDKTIISRNGTTLNDVLLSDLPISTATQAAIDAISTSGGGFTSTAFSTTLAFNGVNKEMIQQAVTGALSFISSGSTAGTQINMCLVANGTNVPTFASNFKEATGSSGYDNTNNVKNYLQFLYTNNKPIYSIFQEVGDIGASDVTAPTLTSATVQNATPTTLTLVFSEALDQTKTLNAADFTLSGSKTDSSPIYVNATTVSMTVTAFTNGESITLDVAAGAVRDLAGNNLAAITARAITNNVGAAPTAPAQVTGLTLGTPTSTTQPLTWTAPANGGSAITDYLVEYKASSSGAWLTFSDGVSSTASATVTGLTASTSYDYRVSAINAVGTGTASAIGAGSTAATSSVVYVNFANLSGATEAANGPGFDYQLTATNGFTSGTNVSLAGDGNFTATYTSRATTSDNAVLYLATTAGSAWNTAGAFGLYPEIPANGLFYRVSQGVTGGIVCNVVSNRTPVNGDHLRIRRNGTALFAEVSSDAGGTWTTLHNYVATSSVTLYPTLWNLGGVNNISLPRGDGLA